jgi:pimeloyl-ACP methyl ester carboxylesterase
MSSESSFNQIPHSEAPLRTLEEQYNNPEIIGEGRNKIEIIDIRPENLKTPVPIILVPGWSATAHVLKENVTTLAERGRRVIVASASHGVDTTPQEIYPEAEMRKTEALMQALDHKGIDKADAISHSEASLFMTMGAMLHKDRFRNFVLVSPAGLIGPDNMPRLATDFTKDISGQTIKALFNDHSRIAKMWKAYTEFGKSMAEGPIMTIHEMNAIVNMRLEDILTELKSRGHGISIIHTADDKAFPMDRMQKQVKENMIDGFVSVGGSHNELYLKPQGMSEMVDHLFDRMEKPHESKPNLEEPKLTPELIAV